MSVTGSGALWVLRLALLGMLGEVRDGSVASVEWPGVLEIVSSKLSRCFIRVSQQQYRERVYGGYEEGIVRIGYYVCF